MKKRLIIVGWYFLMLIAAIVFIIFGVLLSPIWAVVWLITGWWIPMEFYKWVERNFPTDITTKPHQQ